MTVCGSIGIDTYFAPARMAETYWQMYNERSAWEVRYEYPEVPPRVEYALTERTHSLLPHINALIEWALENKDAIIKDRKKANR